VLKFQLGGLLGFALGWAVGSGRATELWEQLRGPADGRATRTSTGSRLDRSA
jgi:hypothetical protein